MCQTASLAVRKWRENEKMQRKWRENKEIERKWRENEQKERDSLSIFPHFLFISSPLYISYIKITSVKYGTIVASVTKNLTYAL